MALVSAACQSQCSVRKALACSERDFYHPAMSIRFCRVAVAAFVVGGAVGGAAVAPRPAAAALPPLFGRIIDFQVNDLLYDRGRDQLIASVGSTNPQYGNSLVVLDPKTAEVLAHTFVGSEPNQLELSSDGSTLYVGLDGADSVAQLNWPARTIAHTMALEPYLSSGTQPGDLAVDPADPKRVVVSRRGPYSPAFAGLVVFQDGVALANTTSAHTGSSRIEFGSQPGRLYGYNDQHTGFEFFRNTVSNTGVVQNDVTSGTLSGFSTDIKFAGGRLYGSDGEVVDPEIRRKLGTFALSASGPSFTIDTVAQRAYFLSASLLQVFDTTTFVRVGEYALGGVTGQLRGLEQVGPGRFVAHSSASFGGNAGELVMFSLVPSGGVPLVPGVTPVTPDPVPDTPKSAPTDPELDARGEFTPLPPARVLDTRESGPIGPGQHIDVQIAGRGGVPAANVDAVVVNATVTGPTAAGFVTVWPTGDARPEISSLNFVSGLTVPNLVTVALGNGGKISLFNSAGTTDALLDIAGYYTTANGNRGSRFVALTPNRILDTRNGPARSLGPQESMKLQVAGTAGVPASGVTAVVMNVTAANASEKSFVTIYPSDVSRPLASNLNLRPGPAVPNLVTVQLSPSGSVDLYNAAGKVDLIADVAGYYVKDYSSKKGRFVALHPFRLYDTRNPGNRALPGGFSLFFALAETTFSGVVLNVTAVAPTADGFFSLYPFPSNGRPLASNVNFSQDQVVANAAIVATTPYFALFHGGDGTADALIDIFGFFT
jgi:hypothetical protein